MALTIQERIKDLRVERGLTLELLAEETGLSRSALGSYESNDTKDISHYAILKLAKYYDVTTDYLLGQSEMKKHPDAALADLHLSDEMIEVLKSGQLNTAILSELATHPDFGKLLADVEIYVNGMAAMQIQNLNAWMDVVRAEILEKYQPAENDSTFALLEAAHIDEGEYFSNRIHRDMDGILADIREAHRGRSDKKQHRPILARHSSGQNGAVLFCLAGDGSFYIPSPAAAGRSFPPLRSEKAPPAFDVQADFAISKSHLFRPACPQTPPVLRRENRCVPKVDTPISPPPCRGRYNTLDLASKIVCQGRPRPLWIPPPRNRPVSLDSSHREKLL